MKAEICDKIDARIEEVNSDQKREIHRLETDISHKLEPILVTSQKQSEAIRELEIAADLNAETTHRLTVEVKRISRLLKCLDLEGRSKRQNLRIVGVKEGKEQGQNLRDFTAQLLQDILALDEKLRLDRAHIALRAWSDGSAPPRHLLLRVHHCYVLEDILQKVANNRNLTFQGENI